MMFKIFLGGLSAGVAGSGQFACLFRPAASASHKASWFRGAVLAAVSILVFGGCANVGTKLPPADLKTPGWTVHQGQAVWRMRHGSREVAGDILIATRSDGEAFIQFSKTPFPLVIAQQNAHQWQADIPPQNKHYAGRGKPPKRLIWLYLARVLAGQPPPKGWTWHHDASGWRLANGKTGEAVEGFFNDNQS